MFSVNGSTTTISHASYKNRDLIRALQTFIRVLEKLLENSFCENLDINILYIYYLTYIYILIIYSYLLFDKATIFLYRKSI